MRFHGECLQVAVCDRSAGSIRKRLPKRALLAHARVAGCKASLSGLACPWARPSRSPMRTTDKLQRWDRDRRANIALRSSPFTGPKPPLGRPHQNDRSTPKDPRGFTPSRVSTDHCGASSIASALGFRMGATPRRPNHANTLSSSPTAKRDILTLLQKETFSFCLDTGIPELVAASSICYSFFEDILRSSLY
jgi:hypothetical protein